MSEVHCELQKILNPDTPTLTVGEKFGLKCQGEVPKLEPTEVELRLDAADKYKLSIVKFENQSEGFQLLVLSDLVGKHQLKAVQIVDSKNSVVIPELQFEVVSVQDPQNPVQEPYGLMGPLSEAIPLIYWILLLGLISLIGMIFTSVFYRKRQTRLLLQKIFAESSNLSPERELFQFLRRLQRENSILLNPQASLEDTTLVQGLDQSYRRFLSRTYEIPALGWPLSRFLKVLRKSKKSKSSVVDKTQSVLRELERAQKSTLRSQDLLQLISLVRESSEQILQEARERK